MFLVELCCFHVQSLEKKKNVNILTYLETYRQREITEINKEIE